MSILKYKNKVDPNLKIEDLLDKDEKIIWTDKPVKKAFILNKILGLIPIALIWLAFDAAFIAMFVSFWTDLPIVVKVIIPVFFVLHLAPVWICVANIVFSTKQWKYTQYAITNRRIIIKSGLFAAGFNSVYYHEIKSISVHVGLIDKWCGVGDIIIKTGSPGNNNIIDISNHYQVYQKLEKISRDISTDVSFPNAYRPENNPGYKTNPEEIK